MAKKNRIIGYARVSTLEQKLDRQQIALKDYGCDIIFEEKVSGKKKQNRPQYKQMIKMLKEGDMVVTTEIDRMSRSTQDLIHMVNDFKKRGVGFVSINDTWLNTQGPMGDFIFTIMAGLAQYERAITSSRVREGMAAAQAKGVKFGAPRKNAEEVDAAIERYFRREATAKQLIAETGISRTQWFYHVRVEKARREEADKKKKTTKKK
ncbi:DNA-invertase hin [Candidatus Izimaplasma bacterium HR1]|jgi:DNA invertase Pin-like site-specific DNA recombinase|uniref:recombinase family protein n=1 Tax=Candidatus Izimoplasma sp. HR1 TaxID=1541959 RepID=UPI0004F83123|nr:DNA-invertase hin [Candidatus Izimaplasma bacterium HR1]